MRMGVVRLLSPVYGRKEVIESGLHSVIGGKDHITEAIYVCNQLLQCTVVVFDFARTI